MRRILLRGLAAAALLLPSLARAADHADGPAATAEPAADITDLFAWTSPDGAKINLVMDVFPGAVAGAKFATNVQYVFHTQSRAAYGQVGASSEDVVCTFDTAQKVSCWAGTEYVTGDASATTGLASTSGKLKVFAGLRNDPFFFNLDGFKDVVATVKSVAGQLGQPKPTGIPLNASGCPDLSGAPTGSTPTYQQILLDKLTHTSGGAAQDHFKGMNVLSLVVQVDKSILTAGGPVVSVWGSTNRP